MILLTVLVAFNRHCFAAENASVPAIPHDPSALTLERIFGATNEFRLQDFGPARWLKDGTGYATLEAANTPKSAKEIVRYEIASGHRDVLVAATNLQPKPQAKPLKIEDYAWSEDGRKLLVFTAGQRVWRRATRGDYWVLDLQTKVLKQLGGHAPAASLMFATLSPDSHHVAYIFQNNLYVQSLDDWRIRQLTRDGSATIINGTSDWVYEEEFGLRNGLRWSPDGKFLAYWQFDVSSVSEFKLINNTDSLYPKVNAFAYPKAGETNAAVRVGVVRATGGRTRWFQPDTDPRNHYIPEMTWMPDSRQIVFQHLNRLQNTNQVLGGDLKTGALQTLFTDRDEAWIDVEKKWVWLDHGKQFLWLSERDGWRHIYSVNATNHSITLLTPGAFDALAIVGVDEKLGGVYFIASPEHPTQRYLYRVPLTGGPAQRVTPDNLPGTHSYDIAEDGRHAFHTSSRFGQPPTTDLITLPEHKVVRVLADNSALREKLAKLKTGPTEFFRVTITNGVELDAWCLQPPEFDSAKQYPLLFHVYGEPASTIVNDQWGGEKFLWHALLAQQGYVVIGVDNRGTPAPRGREWRKCIYRRIGVLAAADQAAAAREILRTRPWLDPKRVGIWGWSGGGSMSLDAIFKYPEVYHAALAVAFVSDQHLYDSVYQERYLGLPAENVTGYREGSAINFVSQLQGDLLLCHGTGDDNCHYQNCERLVNELIKQNKSFSLMSYPNRSHAISEGENTRRHLYETLTRFLNEHLPASKN
jgi:dipeptidyl-peptidase-4